MICQSNFTLPLEIEMFLILIGVKIEDPNLNHANLKV